MQAAFTPPSTLFTFIAHCLVCHQHTLHTARLLDPCFKTGWREEDFKRAGLGDWWALHGSPANQGTMNCPPTVEPPPRRSASIETLGFSSARPSSLQAPRKQTPVWGPPVRPCLLSWHAALFRPHPVNQARAPPLPILFPLCNFRFF